jgi:hypothetical protein
LVAKPQLKCLLSEVTEIEHVHQVADGASVVKFIEKNWGLSPLTARSRDNLPNPTMDLSTSYVPGGLWDSGTFQPLDFFGDGPRIPLIVVSPYSTGGNVVHSYNDHAFVEGYEEGGFGKQAGLILQAIEDLLEHPLQQVELRARRMSVEETVRFEVGDRRQGCRY